MSRTTTKPTHRGTVPTRAGRAPRPHPNGTTYEATLALHAAAQRMLAMRHADDRRQAEARLWVAASARGTRRSAVLCDHARALSIMAARHAEERMAVEQRLWRSVLALDYDLSPQGAAPPIADGGTGAGRTGGA